MEDFAWRGVPNPWYDTMYDLREKAVARKYISKKVCKKSSRELGKKVCRKSSKELGEKVCKKSRKELGKKVGKKSRK